MQTRQYKTILFSAVMGLFLCLNIRPVYSQPTVANWEEIDFTPGSVSNTPNIIAIAYGNNTYAAIGFAGAQKSLFTSTNGENWTVSSFSLPLPSSFPDDIVFLDNEFKLVTNGSIYTSPDLETWTFEAAHSVFTARNLKKVNTLYFQGGEGNFATSTDGLTWTNPMSGADYLDLEYGNNIYVLVGRQSAKGILYTSTNGTTWDTVFSVADDLDMFYAVDFHDGNFILSGNNGIIGKSTNGTDWTFSTPTGTNNTLFSIRYILDHWVVSAGFRVYYSEDGDTWTESTVTGSTGSLRRVEAFNGTGFIPGNTGKIIKTVDVPTTISNYVNENSLLNIFPNPTVNQLNIQSDANKISAITITDVTGKVVFETSAIEENTTTINTTSFISGLYFLNIKTENGSTVKRFLKD